MKRVSVLLATLLLLSSAVAFAAEWTGMVMSKDGKLSFKTDKGSYSITNSDKAMGFENKKVMIMGKEDKANMAITIETISEEKAAS